MFLLLTSNRVRLVRRSWKEFRTFGLFLAVFISFSLNSFVLGVIVLKRPSNLRHYPRCNYQLISVGTFEIEIL